MPDEVNGFTGAGSNSSDIPWESTQWDLFIHERQLSDFGTIFRALGVQL
jgi:hypothetical protein